MNFEVKFKESNQSFDVEFGKVIQLGQPLILPKEITENGTYRATEEGANGYSPVVVNVPIPDGYIEAPDVAAGLAEFPNENYLVNGADLTAVGEAISAKSGVEKPVFPDGWKEAVEGIGGYFELYDTPVDNIYTLTSEVAESTTNATLETYTLTPLTGSDFSFLENIGLTVATIEYLGEDVEGITHFKRGIALGFNVRVHGFAISSPVAAMRTSLYNMADGRKNITQVNKSDYGLFASCARSTNTWVFSYSYSNTYKALPGDYRFTIRRYKLPVSFFGGNAE